MDEVFSFFAVIGWVDSMFGPEKISSYMGRLNVVSRCSFVSSQW